MLAFSENNYITPINNAYAALSSVEQLSRVEFTMRQMRHIAELIPAPELKEDIPRIVASLDDHDNIELRKYYKYVLDNL